MDIYDIVVKSLEDAELDIYSATDTTEVENIRRKALADIHGAQAAEMFSEAETAGWRKRIQSVATFRRASLEFDK